MLEKIIKLTKRIKFLAVKSLNKHKNIIGINEREYIALIYIPDICGTYKPQSVACERVALMREKISGATFSKRYKYKETKRLEFIIHLSPENILDYLVTSNGTYVKVKIYATR